MITGLDHVAVAVRDFDAAVDGYRRLLGREPDLEPRDGAKRAWFRFPNMALEVIAPDGEGAAGDRLRARLDEAGEGTWLAAFKVEDPASAAHALKGSVGLFSQGEAYECARRLEQLGRSGDLNNGKSVLEELLVSVSKLTTELRALGDSGGVGG